MYGICQRQHLGKCYNANTEPFDSSDIQSLDKHVNESLLIEFLQKQQIIQLPLSLYIFFIVSFQLHVLFQVFCKHFGV